jgi:serine phosphatase RsbU (regulator of sigma subunit)
MNSHKEFYSEQKLINKLNQVFKNNEDDLVKSMDYIISDIEDFTNDTMQCDDITMLIFNLKNFMKGKENCE